jgi:hypothetical protein
MILISLHTMTSVEIELPQDLARFDSTLKLLLLNLVAV